jgi:uncharacterized protein with HEPN domain
MSYNRNLDWMEDIVNAIRFVTEYAETVTEDTFSVDHAVQNVILREITIIGEAVRRLTQPFIESHPEIPFADMI